MVHGSMALRRSHDSPWTVTAFRGIPSKAIHSRHAGSCWIGRQGSPACGPRFESTSSFSKGFRWIVHSRHLAVDGLSPSWRCAPRFGGGQRRRPK
jgi:hypothetical protein